MDQANAAGAGDALFVRFAGLEGKTLEDDTEALAGALAQGSPPSMSELPVGPPWLPRTSASKLVSSPPFDESNPFDAAGPPKLMKASRVVAVALLAPNSCSFRVCSCSTRAEVDLINAM